ncbi:unnamed protein product [Caenorhabditis angaria]|uniref:Tectonic domain-containing protein n=1 Tax=Caenorhabditis angaria TaxID=860376 RepID=A0A9P1IPU5_9PELO|nr:unnamed protein product [Caenorhabditis angaria]
MLDGRKNAFKIPATLSDGDFCSGTRNIELNQNTTTKCRAKIESIENCKSNKFLNSNMLFGQKIAENITFQGSFFEPISNSSGCFGVIQTANIYFIKNISTNSLSSAFVEIVYDSIKIENFQNFEQTFNIFFVDEKIQQGKLGYSENDAIYSVSGMVAVPLNLPILQNCLGTVSEKNQVLFKQEIAGTCFLENSKNCEEARFLAKKFYEQIFPMEILSVPSDDAQPALVNRINVTWEEKSPSQKSCRLPVSSRFLIYFSKQGTIKNYREIIVGASFDLSLDYIDYNPGQTIHLPLIVKFSDVTPKPKSVFASLPYIDIRLPNDFFYPFIRNSSNKKTTENFIFIILNICFFTFIY